MRLATVTTDAGLRLHVHGRSGYVDVAQATGDDRLSELTAVLAGGPEVLELVQSASEQDGRELTEAEYGPAVPSPRRVLCFGVNYLYGPGAPRQVSMTTLTPRSPSKSASWV